MLAGGLAAALAGLGAGAEARPPAPLTLQALGPRMDFDLAAHALPPTLGPPRNVLAGGRRATRDG